VNTTGWVTVAGFVAFVVALLVAGWYVAQQVAGGVSDIAQAVAR